jgi:aminomethyltransferase
VPDTLRRTALYDRHVAAGAKMVEFAGWEMPVQYEDGVRAEHMAVRESVGVFDVSHMGQIETSGPGSLELLQLLITNDLGKVEVGGAQYGLLCREDGGVLDDLFTYRLAEDRWLTVTNAANHDRDLEWFRAHATGFEVEVEDRIEDYAMLAVQGPCARAHTQPLCEASLPERMTATTARLAGAQMLVCGTGYTGEDGVELLLAPADAPAIWDALIDAGATPAGLAARDTLRLEACYHLYGNDLALDRNPIEAGLGWCCREETGFIGVEAVRRARAAAREAKGARGEAEGATGAGAVDGGASGDPERFVAFAIDGPGIARPGNPIAGGGVVTSGTFSPSLGYGIGLAYVPAGHAAPGARLEIDVRGKMRAAVVREKPLYRRDP